MHGKDRLVGKNVFQKTKVLLITFLTDVQIKIKTGMSAETE